MRAQLIQVFRTYARRPLVRMIAAIALLIAIGLFAQGFWQTTHTPIEPEIQLTGNWAPVRTATWDAYFRDHAPAELDSLMMTDFASMLTLDPKEGTFPDLTPLVNLTTLKLNSSDLTLPKVQEVRSLRQLRSLALNAPSIPAGTFSLLGPKLRQLEIPLRLLLSRADEVPQLVELQMLRVDRNGLTPQALSVIAQIPNLEHLVLSWRLTDAYADAGPSQPTPASQTLTPATLRPLAGHPRLEAIFAYWPPQTPRTMPALPGVQLYPAGISRNLPSALLMSLFFTAAIAVIVALQAWAHFIVQSAAVVPGYARPHQLAAMIVLLGGGLVGAVGLWLAEIAILPGLAVALALPAAILALLTASQSQSQILRTICLPLGFLAAAVIWLPVAIAVSLPPVIAGELVWLLRGEFTWIPIVILVGESALLGFVLIQLPNLTYRVYETSSLRPGLSPWDPQQQRRAAYGSQKRRLGLPHGGEQYGHLRGDSNWQKARLWRAGNAYRPRNALMFGGMFVLFFVVIQLLIRGASLSEPTVWKTCMAQLGIFALLFPLVSWNRRCRSLQVESLRPVSRKGLVRQLFTALAVDQSLALIPFAIAMAYSIKFPRPGGSVAESYSFIACGLAGLVWIYAVSTALFAIKRAWVLGGYAVAMIVLPMAGVSVIAIAADEMKMPSGQQIELIYIASLAIFVLALGILWATYRGSLRREWG